MADDRESTPFDQHSEPLRDIAENPQAFAKYLAQIQRVILETKSNLEKLSSETRVVCRGSHVEGDRWYHPRLRAHAVEASLRRLIGDLERTASDLEKSAHRRMEHDEKLVNVDRERREKAIEKQQKNRRPEVRAAPPESEQESRETKSSPRGDIASIFDLGKRSA